MGRDPVERLAGAGPQKAETLVDEEVDPPALTACARDLVMGVSDRLEVQLPVGRSPVSERLRLA